jgi:hypothetical protein
MAENQVSETINNIEMINGRKEQALQDLKDKLRNDNHSGGRRRLVIVEKTSPDNLEKIKNELKDEENVDVVECVDLSVMLTSLLTRRLDLSNNLVFPSREPEGIQIQLVSSDEAREDYGHTNVQVANIQRNMNTSAKKARKIMKSTWKLEGRRK